LSQTELEDLHRKEHPELYVPPNNFTLFSDERAWSLSPTDYMRIFTAPLPQARYATLILSTAGHWTTTLMSGFRDEPAGQDAGFGITSVLDFFGVAMRRWADEVQRAIAEDRRAQTRRLISGSFGPASASAQLRPVHRQAVVRAYLPGHEDCHAERAPWDEWHPYKWKWYNWAWIGDMNHIFQVCLVPP